MIDIFVFIDALGWDIVEKTDYLSDLLPYRKAMTMQFGYSCTAISTILSGKQPKEHGHLGLFRYAPESTPFRFVSRVMKMLHPRSFWSRNRVRHWLSKAVKKWLGFTGYFQLYQMTPEKLPYIDYCEKDNLFLPGGMTPVENLADALKKAGVSYHISDWHQSDAYNLEAGIREIQKGTQFIFLYVAEMDALRHANVLPRNWYVIENKLAWYKEYIQRLIMTAQETGQEWSLTVFSDHGMTPLTHTIDVKGTIEKTGLVFGKDYGACYDSTMLRIHYLTPGSREKIEAAMKQFAEDGHWLTEEEERKYGIWREDRAFGDAIFLADPGIQIVPSDMGLKPLCGMHGFLPEDEHSKAAIISSKPIPENVNGVYDYFSLMEQCFQKEHKENGNQN